MQSLLMHYRVAKEKLTSDSPAFDKSKGLAHSALSDREHFPIPKSWRPRNSTVASSSAHKNPAKK
jgi:hypothetical protein